MGKNIKKYFLEQLNKTNEVSKNDIINLAQEHGIELKKRISKEKVINLLVEHGYYDKLFECFNEFIKVPS